MVSCHNLEEVEARIRAGSHVNPSTSNVFCLSGLSSKPTSGDQESCCGLSMSESLPMSSKALSSLQPRFIYISANRRSISID